MQGTPDLWLPGDHVHREEFDLERAVGDLERVAAFRRELKSIDDRLDIVWARRGATSFPRECRWYIVRRNEDPAGREKVPPSMWMVHDGQGGYDEPSEKDLLKLQAADMWSNRENWQAYLRRKRDQEAAAERAAQAKRDERDEHGTAILKHHFDTQVAISGEQRAKLDDQAAVGEAA